MALGKGVKIAVALFVGLLFTSHVAVASEVEAGPIWSNEDAKTKCPATCVKPHGAWTGQWHTTIWNRMSVCECQDSEPLESMSRVPDRLAFNLGARP